MKRNSLYTLPILLTAALLLALALLASGCGGGGERGVTISGQVTDTEENPIEEALVIIGGKTALTETDGTFTVKGIPDDEPTQPLTVSKTGYYTLDEPNLPLDVQQPLQLSLTLLSDPNSFGTVRGRVSDAETGAGIGRLLVDITSLVPDITPEPTIGHTAEDGFFQISGVPTGAARVEVEIPNYLPFSQEIQVISGDETPELSILLTSGEIFVSVEGEVFDVEERLPIPGALVEVEEQQSITDPDGRFYFPQVPTGTRTFTVQAEGYDPAVRNVEVREDMPLLQIGLAKTGTSPPSPPHSIKGTVTLSDQTDYSGVTVEAVEETSPQICDSTATTQDGRYFLWVPTGTFTVTASKEGYQSATHTIDLLPAETVTLDFTLSPLASPQQPLHKEQFPRP